MPPTVRLRPLAGTPDGVAAVNRLHRACADYVARITGDAPDDTAGDAFFSMLPPGRALEHKFTFSVDVDGRMAGCVDLVRGWPDAATAVIGLLLLDPAVRGRGVGRRAFEAIESIARGWPEIERLRLAVVESNAVARPFWEHLGFRATGQTRPHEAGSMRSTAHVFMKPLRRDAP